MTYTNKEINEKCQDSVWADGYRTGLENWKTPIGAYPLQTLINLLNKHDIAYQYFEYVPNKNDPDHLEKRVTIKIIQGNNVKGHARFFGTFDFYIFKNDTKNEQLVEIGFWE